MRYLLSVIMLALLPTAVFAQSECFVVWDDIPNVNGEVVGWHIYKGATVEEVIGMAKPMSIPVAVKTQLGASQWESKCSALGLKQGDFFTIVASTSNGHGPKNVPLVIDMQQLEFTVRVFQCVVLRAVDGSQVGEPVCTPK